MSRNLKSLALALVGVLALAAMIASSASAVSVHSGSTSGETFFTAINENTNQLDLENGSNVKCGKVIYEGSYKTATATELTVKPTYTECLSSGQQTTIDSSKCHVLLKEPVQTTDTDNYAGSASLTCAGGSLLVSVGDPAVSCTVTVHAQEVGGGNVVKYADITTAEKNRDDVTISLPTVAPFATVAYTASGSVCGTNGIGKLTGALTAKGYSASSHSVESQVDLWVD